MSNQGQMSVSHSHSPQLAQKSLDKRFELKAGFTKPCRVLSPQCVVWFSDLLLRILTPRGLGDGRTCHGLRGVMSFRQRGIQGQSEAWAKLYAKRDREAMKVANPKDTLRKMYDKLVTPQLLKRGAHVPLPFEDENDPTDAGKEKDKIQKKKKEKQKSKKDKKSKKKKAKKAKSSSSSTSSSTSSSSSTTTDRKKRKKNARE
eukprot:s254_g23.t1